METIESRDAWYPAFHIGGEPRAVLCKLAIVKANDRLYFKTPFAFVNYYGGDLDRAVLPGGGYYATEADCMAYLRQQYPWCEAARPIMELWFTNRHYYGDIVGDGRTADAIDVSVCGSDLPELARGHKRFTLKRVKEAVKVLGAVRA